MFEYVVLGRIINDFKKLAWHFERTQVIPSSITYHQNFVQALNFAPCSLFPTYTIVRDVCT